MVGASTTAPYSCAVSNATPAAAAAAASGASLYGVECAAAVDRQLDCDALCVCTLAVPDSMDITTGCSDPAGGAGVGMPGQRYCNCPACDDVPPVSEDPSYETVTSLNATDATSSRRLQQVLAHASCTMITRLELSHFVAEVPEILLGFSNSIPH